MSTFMTRSTACAAILSVALLAGSSPTWAAQGSCGQPVSQGSEPTLVDCLYIARASVGAATECPDCACDTNGSGEVRITDGLRCLWFVVGQDVTLDCPPCEASTTTTLPPCASCNDVLVGLADEADLCEDLRPIYDAMDGCLCDQCGSQCEPICGSVILPGDEPVAAFGGGSCLGCYFDQCSQALRDCIEN